MISSERTTTTQSTVDGTSSSWWRGAAIYQVYLRSFADGDGDGIGDLLGARAKLPYLAELGIDAIWFCPWYPSPMADGGYDVADYRDIEPVFGTLAQAEEFIAEAHRLGIRIIIDIVPNHCSDQHPWFAEALAAAPGSPARQRFWFRPGRGADGAEPPNDWQSRFGGPAWTRTVNADGTPGEWYLHLYAAEQPDLNWTNPEVHAEFADILRFWFDRGVDGLRIDVADGLVKAPGLPDVAGVNGQLPFSDLDGVHEIYRAWRRIAEEYGPDRIFVGEMWLPDPERFARYLRPDELHSAFNFDFLSCPWEAGQLRSVIQSTVDSHAPVGAPPTWVLSNHDVTRHVTRYGRAGDTGFTFADRRHGTPVDRELGTRRARAAALLSLSLPGGAYVYQGEELGLWEVEDVPDELRQDPVFARTQGADPGRDGCRVPLPWAGQAAPFGFGPEGSRPWLPQPQEWVGCTAEAQQRDPGSMHALYREALRLRRELPALGDGPMRWLDRGEQVLAFHRPPGFTCVLNLSGAPVPLPAHERVLLASGPLTGQDELPADTAVWLA
ncbi:glycoside hydrolase family 13 protein [Crossiella sp. CA-258035]|uniref:glycoside hydrolase family 13 protein n=1 Tax=Crossiella sp. CA-258035 TaxID=2981138 RepID=UPI0024BC258F|nr:glycoside hydrolase family 13 protein [Crossiella sp. CA-258035]WHT17296.1 glycoside hydrolase family 13 protein [Crossiella sp. CA-258035]